MRCPGLSGFSAEGWFKVVLGFGAQGFRGLGFRSSGFSATRTTKIDSMTF